MPETTIELVRSSGWIVTRPLNSLAPAPSAARAFVAAATAGAGVGVFTICPGLTDWLEAFCAAAFWPLIRLLRSVATSFASPCLSGITSMRVYGSLLMSNCAMMESKRGYSRGSAIRMTWFVRSSGVKVVVERSWFAAAPASMEWIFVVTSLALAPFLRR